MVGIEKRVTFYCYLSSDQWDQFALNGGLYNKGLRRKKNGNLGGGEKVVVESTGMPVITVMKKLKIHTETIQKVI